MEHHKKQFKLKRHYFHACELILLQWQCYSAKELLESFSVDSNGLNLDKFEKVCPAIVQQIESKACGDESEGTKEDVKQSKARGTTIINN